MTTYIQAQFNKVRDLASAKSNTIQFTLQIVGPESCKSPADLVAWIAHNAVNF